MWTDRQTERLKNVKKDIDRCRGLCMLGYVDRPAACLPVSLRAWLSGCVAAGQQPIEQTQRPVPVLLEEGAELRLPGQRTA